MFRKPDSINWQKVKEAVLDFFKSWSKKSKLPISIDSPLEQKSNSMPEIQKTVELDMSNFKSGKSNLANDENTKKVRKFINYEFTFEDDPNYEKTCLQCTEYVCFKMKLLGRPIEWPIKSGRNGGNWGKIFENHTRYKVSDQPSVGCAVSFNAVSLGAVGHVAFVEKVFPNGDIEVSDVNLPRNGIYNEAKILPPSIWKDKYKGRFIDFK